MVWLVSAWTGTARLEAQRHMAKLYDKRSSAAHGKPRRVQDDLVALFILLRSCIMTLIIEREVPTNDKLE